MTANVRSGIRKIGQKSSVRIIDRLARRSSIEMTRAADGVGGAFIVAKIVMALRPRVGDEMKSAGSTSTVANFEASWPLQRNGVARRR